MFQRHLRNSSAMRRLLNCYMYVLMGQLAQTTACSHYHQVRARLARRLLMNRDQVRGNQFQVTQEFLAHMLGVRRVGVTNAANSLREEGLIDYRRGALTILNGPALELVSCACYRGANDMYELALGPLFVPGTASRRPRHRYGGRRISSRLRRATEARFYRPMPEMSAETAAFIFPSSPRPAAYCCPVRCGTVLGVQLL